MRTKFSLARYLLRVMDMHYFIRKQCLNWTTTFSIGDVGVLSPGNQFISAFNIFLPVDHPYNMGNAPESFIPLKPLQESEICTTAHYFPRGYVIASKGVKVTRHSEDPL